MPPSIVITDAMETDLDSFIQLVRDIQSGLSFGGKSVLQISLFVKLKCQLVPSCP